MTKEIKKPKISVRERVETWLKINGHLINKNAWDVEIGMPEGTLQKTVKYGKKLNLERIKKINKRIKKLYTIDGKPYDSV
jgi:hypothetical protein